MNYEETFAHVAKMTTIHSLLTVDSVRHNLMLKYLLKHMGIFKNKFLRSPFLVFLMILGMFTTIRRHYMVSNMRLVLGLRKSLL